MGFKKGLALIMAMAVVITMTTGCLFGGGYKLTSQIIYENVPEYSGNTDRIAGDILTTSTEDLTILSSDYARGVAVVRNDDSEVGVLSFVTGDMVVPFTATAMTVDFLIDSVFGVYVAVEWDLSGNTIIYDMFGEVVLAEEEYDSFSIVGSLDEEYDIEGELISTKYIETVTSLTVDASSDGDPDTIVVNEIDVVEHTRTEIIASEYGFGDIYDDELTKTGLANIGLANYYKQVIGTTTYIYKKSNDKLVNIYTPQSGTYTAEFDGKIFHQTTYAVASEAEDFTYSSGANRYKVETVVFDILSGKTKYIDLDYQILGLSKFNDSEGVANNGYVRIKKIVDGILLNDITNCVIDKDGKILEDVTGYDFTNLYYLDETHFFNTSSRVLYDEEMSPIMVLPAVYNINTTAKAIRVPVDGLYGVIDYEGEVMIPFIYDFITNIYHNGSTRGFIDGEFKFVNIDNTTVDIDPNLTVSLIFFSSLTITRTETVNSSTNMYTVSMLNNSNETLASFQSTGIGYAFYNFDSVYGDYYLYRYLQIGGEIVFANIELLEAE